MDVDYPVVVLGAGPAGARTAELLARGGLKVLLLGGGRKREKLCGGLLTRAGSRALDCALPAEVLRRPAAPPLEFHDADNHLCLRYDPQYTNMHRGAFDSWLTARARAAGAVVEPAALASKVVDRPGCIELATSNGDLRCYCLVDASGHHAVTQRHRGTPPLRRLFALQGRISCQLSADAMWAVYISSATPFYGWIIPVGGGEFLLGAGFPWPGADGRRPPIANRDGWARLAPFIDYLATRAARPALLEAKPRGCAITWIRTAHELRWGQGAVLPVGEAAGLVSPSSGGGIHYALLHAQAAAAVLLELRLDRTGGWQHAEDWDAARSRIRAHLAPVLRRLHFCCLKAAVAACPATRRIGAALLPLALRRPLQRLV